MSILKRFLQVVVLISILALFSVMIGYYLIIYKPNVDKLEWLSVLYDECIASSSSPIKDDLYVDLQEVMSARHSAEKLQKYLRVMQDYSRHGKCELSSAGQCVDAYLFVSRSFLVRGNEQDLKAARDALRLYRKSMDRNLYYDTILLAITIFEGRKKDADSSYYESSLKEMMSDVKGSDYYSQPHDQKACRMLLDHIGATYSKMGEYSSDLFITTYLLNF